MPELKQQPDCGLSFEINPNLIITQTSLDSAIMLAALSLDLESGKFSIQTDDVNFVDQTAVIEVSIDT